MREWIDLLVEWFKGLNIFLQIGLPGFLFFGLICCIFKKPWGAWRFGQKYKKFNDMGHQVDHPDEYYRNYYKKKCQ